MQADVLNLPWATFWAVVRRLSDRSIRSSLHKFTSVKSCAQLFVVCWTSSLLSVTKYSSSHRLPPLCGRPPFSSWRGAPSAAQLSRQWLRLASNIQGECLHYSVADGYFKDPCASFVTRLKLIFKSMPVQI